MCLVAKCKLHRYTNYVWDYHAFPCVPSAHMLDKFIISQIMRSQCAQCKNKNYIQNVFSVRGLNKNRGNTERIHYAHYYGLTMFTEYDQWLHSWTHCKQIVSKSQIWSTCFYHVSAQYMMKHTYYLIAMGLQCVCTFFLQEHGWTRTGHIGNPGIMFLPVFSQCVNGEQEKFDPNGIRNHIMNYTEIIQTVTP